MRRRIEFTAAAAALVMIAGAGHVAAQCTTQALTSGTTAQATSTPQPYSFNQTDRYWTVAAVRSGAGSNWNLTVYQSSAAFPTCVSTSLASSSQTTGVDLVVGDFNLTHNNPAICYPQVTRLSGSTDGTVEWDSGAQSLVLNGPKLSRTTGPSDVVEIWDVHLDAGHQYRFQFSRTGANARLLLFRSTAGTYWAARSTREFDATGDFSYTAPATGYYGVVVVNDDGVNGTYTLAVGECRSPDALTSGVSVSTGGLAERDYLFDQNDAFFMAIGGRGTSNWNVETYTETGGGTYPGCLTGTLATSSLAAPSVDFVVANFNLELTGTFFARVSLDQQQGSGSARVEWDSGFDFVDVNGPQVDRTTDGNDVLECWDVYFDAGTTYWIQFPTTGANLRMFLFGQGTSWAGRNSALQQWTGSASPQAYVATQTGWHGLVVVNENGVAGTYSIKITQGPVGVADGPAPVTALHGISPNPARAGSMIRFDLHDAAQVEFEVVDVAGRSVGDRVDVLKGAGRWSIPWNGRGRAGSRLSPGIYFLRMRVDGHPVALKKFALID